MVDQKVDKRNGWLVVKQFDDITVNEVNKTDITAKKKNERPRYGRWEIRKKRK